MSSISAYGTNRFEIFKTIGGLNYGLEHTSNVFRYVKNVRCIPQAVFKTVKNGCASGYIGLLAQMDYLLGKAERIIDPRGEIDSEQKLEIARTQKIASRWADSWKKRAKDTRHTMHLVTSFPQGIHTGAIECIIRDTTEELLSQGRNRFEYIAALHTDTNNTHAHIIVNRRNAEGEWFYLARDGEFTYDLFKDTLVKNAHKYDVELNNSSRLSRGLSEYPVDNRHSAMRGIEGTVLDFGKAIYKNQEKGSKSFYVTLQTKFGERTIWGIGLSDVLANSGADCGDTIRITHEGKCPIIIPTKDGKTITGHKNDWRIIFKNKEFGTFDNEKIGELTPNAERSAEKQREMILTEADQYRKFSNILKDSCMALSQAFSAAAKNLQNGKYIDAFDGFMETVVSEADITRDSDNLLQEVAIAKEQMDAIWKSIPTIAISERPRIEERYFKALGDMDKLLIGERRCEFDMKSYGSAYSDEHRKKLALHIPVWSKERFEQYGIHQDEFMARMNIETVSYMLESHWIERDAYTIAAHMKLNMETKNGREEAFRKVGDFHNSIVRDLALKEEDLSDLREKGVSFDTDTLNEIRDLARKDSMTFDEGRKMIENLEVVLGQKWLRDLQDVDLNAFRNAGINVDKYETLDIAEKYSEAMRQQGYNMEKMNQDIAVEKGLLEVNENLKRLGDERRRGDEIREQDLDCDTLIL